MEANEFYKYFKWCNDNEIKIVVLPIGAKYILCVFNNGEEIKGETKYEPNPKLNEVNYGDAIRNLYKQYYLLNN